MAFGRYVLYKSFQIDDRIRWLLDHDEVMWIHSKMGIHFKQSCQVGTNDGRLVAVFTVYVVFIIPQGKIDFADTVPISHPECFFDVYHQLRLFGRAETWVM